MKRNILNFSERLLSKKEMRNIKGGMLKSSANCPGGITIECDGESCWSKDNVGCKCTNADGTKDEKSCPIAEFKFYDHTLWY